MLALQSQFLCRLHEFPATISHPIGDIIVFHCAANSAASSQPRRLRLHPRHRAPRFSGFRHHRSRSPQPHHPLRRRRHRPRRRHHRLFRIRLGPHAVHLLPHPCCLVRPLRPPPSHLD